MIEQKTYVTFVNCLFQMEYLIINFKKWRNVWIKFFFFYKY